MRAILKYPRTPHLSGSELQPGDDDVPVAPVEELRGRHLVVEEKVDGSNSAVSFQDGEIVLQSRGHELTGGARERQFALLKSWASAHEPALRELLSSRYVMYGEWVYARHTIYYDWLPHYFLEFDIYDKEKGIYLDAGRRQALLDGSPVVSAATVWRGDGSGFNPVSLASASSYQTREWATALRAACGQLGFNAEPAVRESDASGLMEGLYVKWEEDGEVRGRWKWVRASFRTAVENAETHWQERPVIPNRLRPGAELFR
jgi:hypothetical protein